MDEAWPEQDATPRPLSPPNNRVATEFHQEQPYWPHADSPNALSAWIALGDVPVERGCMSFISGSHRHTGLQAQNLLDGRDLFGKCPELEYEERVTLPLQAGDCTFHHACYAHMATPNKTDEPRVAHVVNFYGSNNDLSGQKPRSDGPARPTRGAAYRRRAFSRRLSGSSSDRAPIL